MRRTTARTRRGKGGHSWGWSPVVDGVHRLPPLTEACHHRTRRAKVTALQDALDAGRASGAKVGTIRFRLDLCSLLVTIMLRVACYAYVHAAVAHPPRL